MVLQAFRYGDRALFQSHPGLDNAQIYIHFHATQTKFNRNENWGTFREYLEGMETSQADMSVK